MQPFPDVLPNKVLKNFAKFTGVSFLLKLQAEAFSYRTPPVAASALRYLYKLHQKVLENK